MRKNIIKEVSILVLIHKLIQKFQWWLSSNELYLYPSKFLASLSELWNLCCRHGSELLLLLPCHRPAAQLFPWLLHAVAMAQASNYSSPSLGTSKGQGCSQKRKKKYGSLVVTPHLTKFETGICPSSESCKASLLALCLMLLGTKEGTSGETETWGTAGWKGGRRQVPQFPDA